MQFKSIFQGNCSGALLATKLFDLKFCEILIIVIKFSQFEDERSFNIHKNPQVYFRVQLSFLGMFDVM